jgi:hypothetical protein
MDPKAASKSPYHRVWKDRGNSAELSVNGMFHKRGQELLECWRLARWSSKRDRIWVDRFVKSCRPLGMRSKEHFCVKRLSGLTFVHVIVVGTLSLVLAKSV